MKCLSEIELELFVLADRLGERETDPNTKEHVHKCSFCNQRVGYLEKFYDEFERISAKPISSSDHKFIQQLTKTMSRCVHIAYPLPIEGELPSLKDRPTVLFAASKDSEKLTHFDNLGVLSTEDREILVRVIRTTRNSVITLHLISDLEQNYRNVLVTVPDVEGEFISNENGKVDLGKVSLPKSTDLLVKVQTPCAAFDLAPLNLWRNEEIAQTEVVLTNERNNSIKVEFVPTDMDYALKVHLLKITTAGEENRLRVMVSRGEKEPYLKEAEKGVAVFQGLKENGELSIKVFD